MKIEDFRIGDSFYTATGRWVCTDVGSRVIVAVKYEEFVDPQKGNSAGPPYSVAETVFDEYDLEGVLSVQIHN